MTLQSEKGSNEVGNLLEKTPPPPVPPKKNQSLAVFQIQAELLLQMVSLTRTTKALLGGGVVEEGQTLVVKINWLF